ncbi:MAG: OmpA family protein [Phycisphaerales bacterium]|nr:OmpA family protein [Phycisphaerales bacterium]
MFSLTSSKAQYGYDTVKILFPINSTLLDYSAQKRLDSVASVATNQSLLIYGYADYLGNEASNMELAKNRAKNVAQYLCSKKIDPKQILICEGIGEVKRNLAKSIEGYPEDRRVAIFIKKKNSAQHQAYPSATPEIHKMRIAEIKENGELVPIISMEKKKTYKERATTSEEQSKPIIKNRFETLTELKVNEVMRIEAIHFQPTRHFITKESEPILVELLQTLKNYPDLAIQIEGHVCCMKGDGDALDTDTHELKLSENRAHFIYQYLIESGIAASRLGYIGYGKRRPIIAVEKTEEDAQKNRRVEIRVISN